MDRATVDRFFTWTMVFTALIALESEVNPAETIESIDGEISIAFWSFAFVLLLIVTVWFYITQIAPMRRSVAQIDQIDKEEEVANRILEHLSDDLRFSSVVTKDKCLKNAPLESSVQEEDSSVYEYVDDEIHIHYTQYAWDDENYNNSTDFPVSLGTGRRHSMENMDLIFPGLLPSIVEEEEHDDENDMESSEKPQNTDIINSDIQADTCFSNVSTYPTPIAPIVNNNSDGIEPSVNKRYDYSAKETNIEISLKTQESKGKYSTAIRDGVFISKPRESNNSVNHIDDTINIHSLLEGSKSNTNLLSGPSYNRPQVRNDEKCQNGSSEQKCHPDEQESVILVESENVSECTSGGFDDKEPDSSSKQDIPRKLKDLETARAFKFSSSNSDLEASFEQDANEFEEGVKLCVSKAQKISCSSENGLDQHSTRDSSPLHSTDEEYTLEKTATELFTEQTDALVEDTRGLTGLAEVANNSKVSALPLNGSWHEKDDFDNTTHAWTFFSMSGGDDTEKEILGSKRSSDEKHVPTIIIDTYDDGLQSDKLITNEESTMNGHEISPHFGAFETDIDLDDIDLIDSDELENEGEFSIYFKKHVSVTDLDKILSEEGQNDSNDGNPGKILETDLSIGEPYSDGKSVSNAEALRSEETDGSRHVSNETTIMEDTSNVDAQGSVFVSTRVIDCLDSPPTSDDDPDETDSCTDDNSSPKSYTVESLFEDVTLQKDGVYGELVLSKLNEEHIVLDEDSFDPLSDDEDWCEFSEELKRERKTFLFTIPEEEEIGLPEVNLRRVESFGGARDNPIFDKDLDVPEDAQQEQLLKAPIATIDAYDSDFDLDEIEESNGSETLQHNGPIVQAPESKEIAILKGSVTKNEIDDHRSAMQDKGQMWEKSSTQTDPSKPRIYNVGEPNNLAGTKQQNGPTVLDKQALKSDETAVVERSKNNVSVTENGVHDGGNHVREDEGRMSDESPTQHGASEKIANPREPSNVSTDSSKSVKIMKKIKIFVRKEVNVAKENNDSKEVTSVKAKDVIQNPHMGKIAANGGICALKEKQKDIPFLTGQESVSPIPDEVVSSEIVPTYRNTEPLSYEDEVCGISQLNAENMKVTTKREKYAPPKPQPKLDLKAREQVSHKDFDVTLNVTQLPTRNLNEKIVASVKPKIELDVILPCASSVNANAPESVLPLSGAQVEDTTANAKLELEEILEKSISQSGTDQPLKASVSEIENETSDKRDQENIKSQNLSERVVEVKKASNSSKSELRGVSNAVGATTCQSIQGHISEKFVKIQAQPNFDSGKASSVFSDSNLQKNETVSNTTRPSEQKKLVNTSSKLETVAFESNLSRIDTIERLQQVRAQNDEVQINGKAESGMARETRTATASIVEIQSQKSSIRQPNNRVSAKDIKSSIYTLPNTNEDAKTPFLPLNVTASETTEAVHAVQDSTLKAETKLSAVKQEQTKTDSDPKTLNSPSKRKADRKSGKQLFTKPNCGKKLVEESEGVSISVKGKDPQDGRGKRQRKTYLSSCNIRLTKSYEDLRLPERSPEVLQESILEEESPDVQSPQSDRSQTPTTPEDVFESVEPFSIHTAKITVQEVIGDKQRILILNVKKKIHGRGRWKSLNDLDSLSMAPTSPRRGSDLGTELESFAEEDEKMDQDRKTSPLSTFMPIVETKSRPGRRSLPELDPANRSRISSVVSVTPLENRETVTGNEIETRVITARVTPVLQEKSLQNDQSVPEIQEQSGLPCTLPIIKATAIEKSEDFTENERKTKTVQVTASPLLQEAPALSTSEAKQDFKGRVSPITYENEETGKEDNKEGRQLNRVTRVHDLSQFDEVIPRVKRETKAEIKNESTVGHKIKINVSRVKDVRPEVSSSTKATLQKDATFSASLSTTTVLRQRQERESGYGSLGANSNVPEVSSHPGPNRVFVLEGANERSVSSLSSIGDEEDVEMLGESRVMVTDLDALLAQQVSLQSEKTTAEIPEVEKPELKEGVRVSARMKPVPEKVLRISQDEDGDNLVIRHFKQEDPIALEPIIIADAAEQEEVQPVQVISAFLVNNVYDEDELDEVFVEEYTPYGNHDVANDSYRSNSSDADSETSSVSSVPLKHRHRHTRASLEASSSNARNRNESSGSSRTATPVAELENAHSLTSSGANTQENQTREFSRGESSASHNGFEQNRLMRGEKTVEYKSAFTPVSRTADAQFLRSRSQGHKWDEERIAGKKGLSASVQNVNSLPGLQIDRERFTEAADSRKSMPDLSAKKDQTMDDSPYLRGLSAHTRRWLSQNSWMDPSAPQDEEDLMTSELFLYPSNRFQPGSNIDASFLSLANERDFRDDISVSTLSTRPQSPMSEFSFAGETPIWGLRRGSATVIKCANPRCEREEVLFGGEKTTYTSCPACFTYYCARACRRIHWSEHKKVCFFGRINSYIRSFIYLCHKKEALKFQLSKTAKDGHKKKGRGSVMVIFASAQSARKFMTSGCSFFHSPPTYSSLMDLQAEGVLSKHKVALIQNIKDYEPDEEFVLNLAIVAGKMEDLPANPVPRRKVNTVLQVVKIPLSGQFKETSPASTLPSEANTETKVFYLPKCARHEFVNDNEARRHYCRNISKNLKQYGIRLKHDYPDVYEKLCLYVDKNIRFNEPLTVYGNQGKKIVMCKIMPEAGEGESKA